MRHTLNRYGRPIEPGHRSAAGYPSLDYVPSGVRVPGVRALERAFGAEAAPKVRAALRDPDATIGERLDAVDTILGTYGIEVTNPDARKGSRGRGFNPKGTVYYLNAGDPYRPTLVFGWSILFGGTRVGRFAVYCNGWAGALGLDP